MPRWSSLASFGRDLEKWAVEFERNEAHKITGKLARRAQAIAEQEASRDLGGDVEMSGWPRAALATRGKEIRTGHLFGPDGRLAAAGWTTATRGRNVGETGSALGPGATLSGGAVRRRSDGSVANRRSRRARRWNGVTQGKGTGDRVVNRMERELPEIAADDYRRVLKRSFDVT